MVDREVFAWMLAELRAHRLEVAKLPSRKGGYTRVVVAQNAPWYRAFCASYAGVRGLFGGRRRKPERSLTAIRRRETAAALERLVRCPAAPGVYADRLRAAARGLTGGGE